MEITKKLEAETLTLAVSGRLETATAPLLDAEIKALDEVVQSLVFDLSALEYVSSAGLRVILTAQKAMNARKGRMTLSGLNATVKHIFDITGFTPVLSFA